MSAWESEEIGFRDRQPTLPNRQHCCNNGFHSEGSTGSGPGSCHLMPRVLHLPPGWSPCRCQPISAAHPECGSSSGLQPTYVFSHCTSTRLPSLVTSGCPYLLKDTSTWVLGPKWPTSRTWLNLTPQPSNALIVSRYGYMSQLNEMLCNVHIFKLHVK